MMASLKNLKKPNLSKRAFWDVDLNSLDFDKYDEFTIVRVFERGTEDDKKEILKYYGRPKVRHTLTKTTSLQALAKEWAKRLLHLSDTDFPCYTETPRARSFSRY
jgi:hypothetical protein